MKNVFKIFILIAFLFLFGAVFANTINFNARISDGSSFDTGSSFSDSPLTISSGSSIDIETIIKSDSGSGAYKYVINFPEGFQSGSYISNVASGTGICNPTGVQSLNNIFSFYTPDANCIIEFWSTYKALNTGNKVISLLGSGSTTSLLGNISVNVIGANTIIKAASADLNNNGFIDGYRLTLAQNDVSSSFSGIIINGITPLSVSGSANIWTISFADNILSTSDTPQILGTFGGQSLIDPSIQENDNAFMNISVNPLPGTYTGAQIIKLIGSESGSIRYSTSGIANISSNLYSTGIQINSGTILSVFTKDMVGNTANFSFNYSFSCSKSAPLHGSITSYPSCIISCNTGYTLSGNSCNAIPVIGGGGGGGGGSYTTVISSGSNIGTGTSVTIIENIEPKIYFIDIDDSFAKADIIYLFTKGIIKGYSGNIFKPNNPITRAEYLGIIMKTLNIKTDETLIKTDFSDIPADGIWMIKYIEKAKEYGIIGQTIKISKDGNIFKKIFRPNDSITRAEALAMLFSISKISTENTMITDYTDIVIEGGSWMLKYIEKATEIGIVAGQTINGEHKFRPNDSITRAESARIITKTITLIK